MSLITRVAIVTGAAQGIGRSISLRLSHDGLDVVANDIPAKQQDLKTLVREIQASGKRKCLAVTGDVSKEAEVQSLVKAAVEEFGGIDVMVANAGIAVIKPFVFNTLEDWDRVLNVNARGVFLCYREAAIQMIKQGRGGRLIAACSTAGKQGMASLAPYSASKFAVRGLTQSAAVELWQYGITVNAYAPGAVNTPMLQGSGVLFEGEGPIKAAVQAAQDKVVQPENIAGLVSYFVKEESKFITGQSVSINSGTFFD